MKNSQKLNGRTLQRWHVHKVATSVSIAQFTHDYTSELKGTIEITLVTHPGTPVEGPDANPLNLYGFGWLKQHLHQRAVTTVT